jgi:hypothetical protein
MNDPLGGLTWADLDRLADWAAGQLTGAEADRVATLVATDPHWAAAHAALTRAEPAVRSSLHAAAEPTLMPPDVAERLATALASVPLTPRPASMRTGPGPSRPPSQRPPARPPASRPARRRAVVAGFAALVLIAGFGGATLIRGLLVSVIPAAGAPEANRDDGLIDPSWAAPGAPQSTGSLNGEAVDTPGPLASWRYDLPLPDIYISEDDDYEYADLVALSATWAGQITRLGDPKLSTDQLPTTPQQLAACLAGVVAAHPGVVTRVLIARYQGEPALFLAIRGTQTDLIVVVGPHCGEAGATDELASVEVG